MFRPTLRFITVVALLAPVETAAQTDDPTLLSIRRIYASPDFRPESFGPARWLTAGAAFTTLEKSADVPTGQDVVRYDVQTGAREVLIPAGRLVPPGDSVPLQVEDYSWSADEKQLLVFTNSQPVWRQNTRGDYWVLDRTTWKLRKLGGKDAKPSTLMFAKFSPDGRRVGYVREFNLYVEDLAGGKIVPLTTDGSRTVINGTFDWVYEEELDDRDGWRWSPDGKTIAFWQLVADSVRDFNLIDYTDSLYSTVIPIQYPKAGESNSAARVATVSAGGGEIRWFTIPGDPRNNYLARMEWAANSDEVGIQQLNRLQNTNTFYLGDRRTGAVRSVFVDRDSAWVEVNDEVRWLQGGKAFLWESEKDGWSHIYAISRDGSSQKLLTPGNLDVLDLVSVDTTAGYVYYIASPDNPTQRYLYRTRVDGKTSAERISPAGQAGSHGYNVAPNGKVAFHSYSSFGKPPTLDLLRLPSHQSIRTLVQNDALKEKVAALRRGPQEFFQVDVGDGVKLNGWMIKPPDFNPNRKYPVLFSVYGGPGSQTVLDSWGGSGYLWHLLLAQKGYIVASVDNRGTGARGRDWRKIVYGRLGVIETQDQANAARAIGRWSYVDSTRMGIWGWSYGGFMSLNGLFQAPDVYAMAIAVAPVTHWKFYDNIYTERYNGLPQQNKEGYDAGSPLSYVGQMKGKLLLVHGSGDDNVHYQNTESLVNALVTANKQFEFMSYPNRNHSIYGGNTTVHLRDLLTNFVDETLGGSQVMPHATADALTN